MGIYLIFKLNLGHRFSFIENLFFLAPKRKQTLKSIFNIPSNAYCKAVFNAIPSFIHSLNSRKFQKSNIRISAKVLLLFFIFNLVITSLELNAQATDQEMVKIKKKKNKCKRVGYFSRRNPEKLARKLTKNLKDDSSKVLAIHCWMTNNIQYDYKTYLSTDINIKNKRSILKKRKALCYDYSMLFKQLCEYSGIRAEIVTGYTKNPNVDICDTFFLGDHAWNAVYINERWYLLDITWDAGFIVYWRKTLWNKTQFIFTLGKVNKYTYKPKFYQRPSQNYLFKSGDYFQFDHLPENPIWQLTDTVLSIEGFMKDSSYYYIKTPKNFDTYSLEYESERQLYTVEEDTVNWIFDGHSFHRFNKNNQLYKVNAINLHNLKFFREADLKSKDTLYVLRMADSLEHNAKLARVHLDSGYLLMSAELNMKLRHMNLKNDIMKRDIKTLNQSSSKLTRITRKGLFYTKKQSRSNKSFIRNQKTNLRKIENDRRFREASFSSKQDEIDSIKALRRIDSVQNIIDSIENILNTRISEYDQLMNSIKASVSNSDNFQNEKKYKLLELLYLRLSGYDDLDHPIIRLKDTLMHHNSMHDSDLYTNRKLVYDSLAKLSKEIHKLYALKVRMHNKKLSAIRYFKTNVRTYYKSQVEEMYRSEIETLRENLLELEIWTEKVSDEFFIINRQNRRLLKSIKTSGKSTKTEKKFKSKPKYLRKNQKIQKVIYNRQKYMIETYQRRSKLIRTKYEK